MRPKPSIPTGRTEASELVGPAGEREKVILIIDDDGSVREALEKILQQTGYAVVLAADGREGLARLKQGGIDLLLLDLNLPRLSGFDLLDVAMQKCPLTPIIVLTGLIAQCEPGALAGADRVFEKPPDVALLLQSIQKLLSEPPEQRLDRLTTATGTHQAPGRNSRRVSTSTLPETRGGRPGALRSLQAGDRPCAW